MEEKSKLQLIGEIAQANNKNLELIEEINEKEDEIERLNNQLEKEKSRFKALNDNSFLVANRLKEQQEENERLHYMIKEVIKYIGSKEHYEDDFDTEIEKLYKILDKGE